MELDGVSAVLLAVELCQGAVDFFFLLFFKLISKGSRACQCM